MTNQQTNHEAENNKWLSREHVLSLALLAATAIGIYLCCRLAAPFLPSLVWALALAVVALPLHKLIERRLKNRSLAAGVSVLLIGVIVVAPFALVARQIAHEASRSAETVRAEVADGKWREKIERHPRVAAAYGWLEREAHLQAAAERLMNSVPAYASNLLNQSIWFVVEFLVTFLALFYFFRDRKQLRAGVRKLLPLENREASLVFKKAGDTIHATVYGTFVVTIVQGALGGLMFWWLGLPAPILWGAAVAVMALIPFLGSFVIWLPAALFLALEGSWGKALILVGWGVLVVALVDNLLYPLLVGDRLRVHSLPVFIAFVGGFLLFGATGIILGPLVLALTVSLLEIWRSRFESPAAR